MDARGSVTRRKGISEIKQHRRLEEKRKLLGIQFGHRKIKLHIYNLLMRIMISCITESIKKYEVLELTQETLLINETFTVTLNWIIKFF